MQNALAVRVYVPVSYVYVRIDKKTLLQSTHNTRPFCRRLAVRGVYFLEIMRTVRRTLFTAVYTSTSTEYTAANSLILKVNQR